MDAGGWLAAWAALATAVALLFASFLWGLQPKAPGYRDPFTSADEWRTFLCSNVYETSIDGAEQAPALLWQQGFRHPAQVASLQQHQVQALLRVEAKTAQWILQQCGHYAALQTRTENLRSLAPNIITSWISSKSIETDEASPYHPSMVSVWASFRAEVKQHVRNLPRTPARFPHGACAGTKVNNSEAAYLHPWFSGPATTVNRLLRYQHEIEPESLPEGSVLCQWQPEASHRATDSQLGAREVRTRAKEAVTSTVYGSHVKDLGLRPVAGPDRPCRAVFEMKIGERLMSPGTRPGPNQPPAPPPDVVKWWNTPEHVIPKGQKGIWHNCTGVCSQVTRYSSVDGAQFAMFSNYYWSWGCKFDPQTAAMQISPPIPYDSTDPTVTQALHFISQKGMLHHGDPWWEATLLQHPLASRSADEQDGPDCNSAAKRNSRGGAGPSRDPRGSGRRQGEDSSGGRGGSSGKQSSKGTASPSIRRKTELALASASDISSAPRLGCATDQWELDSEVARAAGQLCSESMSCIIGHGALGEVFGCRVGNIEAAAKLAPLGSQKAHTLAQEGHLFQQLKPCWGTAVPAMVACGAMADQEGFVLATQRIYGRHVDPATDGPLLPLMRRALRAVHSHDVLHNDLRPQNWLVQHNASGQAQVYLIDFHLGSSGATEQQRQEEMAALDNMFG